MEVVLQAPIPFFMVSLHEKFYAHICDLGRCRQLPDSAPCSIGVDAILLRCSDSLLIIGLTRKACLSDLAQQVSSGAANTSSAFPNSVPRTLNITDHASLEAAVHALNMSSVQWVLKLSECNRGRGLHTLAPGQGSVLLQLCQSGGGPWVCNLPGFFLVLFLQTGTHCTLVIIVTETDTTANA